MTLGHWGSPNTLCKRKSLHSAEDVSGNENQIAQQQDYELVADDYRNFEMSVVNDHGDDGRDWAITNVANLGAESSMSPPRAAANLRCQSAIIDGEAVVQNGDGASNFEALRSAMRWQPHTIILYAFDLLHLDGNYLCHQTHTERRAKLKNLIGDDAASRIQFSEEFDGDGVALLKACGERGLEGIVSKHALAPYRSGRSKTWLKTKCFTESTFVVVGTDRDRKTGAPIALLAHNNSDGLSYAGAAFIALAGDERDDFFAEVERLSTSWGCIQRFPHEWR